jgi:hypothetical protein
LEDDGRRLVVVYITGTGVPVDRVDVRYDRSHLTVTLSRMGKPGSGGKMPRSEHCLELTLSEDARGKILVDGATGERATAKPPREHPMPEPSEQLVPFEHQGTGRIGG